MSDLVNTDLLDEAVWAVDYWAGEGIGAVIEADIERNDLEALAVHLKESQDLMFQLEYTPEVETNDSY